MVALEKLLHPNQKDRYMAQQMLKQLDWQDPFVSEEKMIYLKKKMFMGGRGGGGGGGLMLNGQC